MKLLKFILINVFSQGITNQGTFDICVYGYDFGSGIKNLNTLSDITISPNPSNGNFVIGFSKNKFSEMNVEVSNIVGQTVTTYNFIGKNSVSFDLSNNPDGVYFVKIKTEDGIITKKVMMTKK